VPLLCAHIDGGFATVPVANAAVLVVADSAENRFEAGARRLATQPAAQSACARGLLGSSSVEECIADASACGAGLDEEPA
jgi:hypothetical protein